jgi:hypothetical protein
MGLKFGTAISCIDGKPYEVVINHKKKYGIDMVTFPGADGIFSGEHLEETALSIHRETWFANH